MPCYVTGAIVHPETWSTEEKWDLKGHHRLPRMVCMICPDVLQFFVTVALACLMKSSDKSMSVYMNRLSINQSINQSIKQPINQSINQSINQPTKQASKQASNQSTNQASNQSINQFIYICAVCLCVPSSFSAASQPVNGTCSTSEVG